MTLSRLTQGDAVDLDLLNAIIDRLNALEDANNVQAYWKFDDIGRASSMTDKMTVQGGSCVLTESTPGSNWATTKVWFPRPFSQMPGVTIMPHKGGWANQLAIFHQALDSFDPVVQQPSNNFGSPIGVVRCNWIAIGPVNQF